MKPTNLRRRDDKTLLTNKEPKELSRQPKYTDLRRYNSETLSTPKTLKATYNTVDTRKGRNRLVNNTIIQSTLISIEERILNQLYKTEIIVTQQQETQFNQIVVIITDRLIQTYIRVFIEDLPNNISNIINEAIKLRLNAITSKRRNVLGL